MSLHNFNDSSFDCIPPIVLHLALDFFGIGILLRLRVKHGDFVAVHVALELSVHLHLIVG